jgi:hypothetical protein
MGRQDSGLNGSWNSLILIGFSYHHAYSFDMLVLLVPDVFKGCFMLI